LAFDYGGNRDPVSFAFTKGHIGASLSNSVMVIVSVILLQVRVFVGQEEIDCGVKVILL
jgi:hypothetical protein